MKKMSKIVLLIFLIGMMSVLNADPLYGFRNLQWGDPSSKLLDKQWKGSSSGGNIQTYTVNNENYSIGQRGKLSYIEYTFFKDRFMKVVILYDDVLNHQKISSALYQKFGSKNFKTTDFHGLEQEAKDNLGHLSWSYTVGDPGRGFISIQSNQIKKESEAYNTNGYSQSVNGL